MQTVVNVAVIYFFLLLAFRLMGKRELGQMSPFELVTLMMVPEIVSTALNQNDYSLSNGLVGISTLFLLVGVTSILSHRFPKLGRVLDGEATVLVAHGDMRRDAMNRERISPDELAAAMHAAGIDRIDKVKWAILEAEGKISFIRCDDAETNRRDDRGAVPVG